METREERAGKLERAEVGETNHEWGIFDEQTTIVYLDSADFVFSKLVEELVLEQLLLGQQACPLGNFDFFHGLSEEESGEDHA
jgi:hypothetical protein